MIRALTLLLPALMPSWRFFPRVGPSPRIEFAVLTSPDDASRQWRDFCPRPQRLPLAVMLRRLVWNPAWNEHLYLVTCAERFLHAGIEARAGEILARVGVHARRSAGQGEAPAYVQMRLLLARRDGAVVAREEVYRSPVHPLSDTPLA